MTFPLHPRTYDARVRLNWVRDEVILVASAVCANSWRGLDGSDPQLEELSRLLRSAPIHPQLERDETFRSAHSVRRKSWDIATQHPDYLGKPTRGGRIDRDVLGLFLADPAQMTLAADEVRRSIQTGSIDHVEVAAADSEEFPEGAILTVVHQRRERDPKLRAKKIARVLRDGGTLGCEVCGFDYGRTYGSRGQGYIEVHHVRPLHDSGPTTTRLRDLALLCSNCHRMIHRTRPWLTPVELRALCTEQISAP